jgi:hypothetical protein
MTPTTADWDSSPFTAAEEAATAAANQANLANRRINAAQLVLNAVEYEFSRSVAEPSLCDVAAVVLRAAAKELGWDAAEELRSIAAELEGPR